MVIGASASDGTAFSRIHASGNHIAVDAEVGHQSNGSSDLKCIGRIVRNDSSALGPVDESITRIRCSRQRGSGAIIIAAHASDGTAFGRTSRCRDFIADQGKVGHKRSCCSHREANACLRAVICSVLRPFDKTAARVGCSGQGTGLTMVIGTGASDRTP